MEEVIFWDGWFAAPPHPFLDGGYVEDKEELKIPRIFHFCSWSNHNGSWTERSSGFSTGGSRALGMDDRCIMCKETIKKEILLAYKVLFMREPPKFPILRPLSKGVEYESNKWRLFY